MHGHSIGNDNLQVVHMYLLLDSWSDVKNVFVSEWEIFQCTIAWIKCLNVPVLQFFGNHIQELIGTRYSSQGFGTVFTSDKWYPPPPKKIQRKGEHSILNWIKRNIEPNMWIMIYINVGSKLREGEGLRPLIWIYYIYICQKISPFLPSHNRLQVVAGVNSADSKILIKL